MVGLERHCGRWWDRSISTICPSHCRLDLRDWSMDESNQHRHRAGQFNQPIHSSWQHPLLIRFECWIHVARADARWCRDTWQPENNCMRERVRWMHRHGPVGLTPGFWHILQHLPTVFNGAGSDNIRPPDRGIAWMIIIQNALECKTCPVEWSCCGGINPCHGFDTVTKRCREYAARPNSCRNSYCQHMEIYRNGTLQRILSREGDLLAEHRCERCGRDSENIVIDGDETHYYCRRCTPA